MFTHKLNCQVTTSWTTLSRRRPREIPARGRPSWCRTNREMIPQPRLLQLTVLTLIAALGACGDDATSIVAAAPEQGAVLAIQGSDLNSLGTLGGATSTAYDINASGVVVGTSTLSDGTSRAFRWTEGGGMVALPAGTVVARGVNAAGEVTGRGVFGTA